MFKKIKQHLGVKSRPNNPSVIQVSTEDEFQDSEKCENKMDIPGSLPTEIFWEILMYLSWYDLRSSWNCCRKWRDRMETFWKRKCMIENYFESEEDLNSKLYQKFLTKYSRWHGIYMYNSQLEYNWIKNYCREIVPDNHVRNIPCKEVSYFSGDVLIIANNDENIIFVIDATTGSLQEKQKFRLEPVKNYNLVIRKVSKSENRLIVVSELKTSGGTAYRYAGKMYIKVWNIETRQSIMSFNMEVDAMVKIVIHQNLVSVITCNDTINIINITKQKVDYERNCITGVFHCSDKFALGTDVSTVILMNLDYIVLMEINCFESDRRIDDIQITGEYLIGLSKNKEADDFRACVWNLKGKSKLYEIHKLLKEELRIYVNENRLAYLCGYQEFEIGNIMKYCRLDSGECIFTFDDFSVTSTSHDFFILHETRRRIFNLRSIKSDSVVSRLCLPEWKSRWKSATWNTKSRLVYFTRLAWHGFTLQIVNFEALMEL